MANAQTTKSKGKVGQPEFVPDYQQLANVASLFPTDEELAVILGCSRRTIAKLKRHDERYIDVINDAQQRTRMKLRQKQMQLAMDGNVSMLMFLGKLKLGQEDQSKLEVTVQPNESAPVIDLNPDQYREAVRQLQSETST